MELTVLEKDKTNLKLEIEDVDESTVHLLIVELMKNEEVKNATYLIKHPEDDKFTISLHMKKGRPLVAVRKTIEGLAKDFKKYRESVQKGLKSTKE